MPAPATPYAQHATWHRLRKALAEPPGRKAIAPPVSVGGAAGSAGALDPREHPTPAIIVTRPSPRTCRRAGASPLKACSSSVASTRSRIRRSPRARAACSPRRGRPPGRPSQRSAGYPPTADRGLPHEPRVPILPTVVRSGYAVPQDRPEVLRHRCRSRWPRLRWRCRASLSRAYPPGRRPFDDQCATRDFLVRAQRLRCRSRRRAGGSGEGGIRTLERAISPLLA